MANFEENYSTSLMTDTHPITKDTLFSDFIKPHPKFASLKVYFPEMTLDDVSKIISEYHDHELQRFVQNLDRSDKFLAMLFFKTVGKFMLYSPVPSESWNSLNPENLILINSDTLKFPRVTSYGDDSHDQTVISDVKLRSLFEQSNILKRKFVKNIYISSNHVNCEGAVVILTDIKKIFENISFISLVNSDIFMDGIGCQQFDKLLFNLLDSGLIVDVRKTAFSRNLEKNFVYTTTQTKNLIWDPSRNFEHSRPDLSESLKEMISKRAALK